MVKKANAFFYPGSSSPLSFLMIFTEKRLPSRLGIREFV